MAADDDEFLDDVFDRALDALAEGRRIDIEAWSTQRPELHAQVEAAVRLALEVAAPRVPGLPAVPGYQVVAELGRGGTGTVFLARQERLGGRLVALKVLSSAGALSERARARFLDEAKALARLRHDHVVTVHDVVEAPALCAYAMEWVEGRSLASLLDAVPAAGGGSGPATPEVFFCRIALQVARALGAVHDAGLVHRDVKPSNVMVRDDGRAVLVDFGLARPTDATITAGFAGTLAYAAPEQLAGAPDEVNARGDVYGLGATLYHALARRRAFDGTSPAALARAMEAGAPALRRRNTRVSRDLDTIVATAMASDPARRYPSAHAFADDLERLLSLQPILARPARLAARLVALLRRNRRAVAGAVAGGVLALALAALAIGYALHRAGIPTRVRAHVEAARLSLLSAEHGERLFIALHLPDGLARNVLDPSAIGRALAEYDTALGLAPDDVALRRERETVACARALGDDVARAEPTDRRALGLLAYLRGDAGLCSRAWEGLDLGSPADPLIDAALGELHLQRDEPALAYPRLEAAARAFPASGFVRVQLAAAALRCGDVERAGRLLDAAQELDGHDRFDSLTAVRAEWHAARGEVAEAKRLFEWMRQHHKVPAVRARYAQWLAERQGDYVAALTVLGEAIEHQPRLESFRRHDVEFVERWWSGLDVNGKRRWLTELAARGTESWTLAVLRQYADSVARLAEAPPGIVASGIATESTIASRTIASPGADRPFLLHLVSALEASPVTLARSPFDPPSLRALQVSAWMSTVPRLASRAVSLIRRLRDMAQPVTRSAEAVRKIVLLVAPTALLGLASATTAQLAWQQLSPAVHPSGRWNMALAADEGRRRVVLFGGWNGAAFTNETWEWDGASWEQLSPLAAPPGRYGPGMVYVAHRSRTLMFGGLSGPTYFNDSWEWDGTDWIQVPAFGGPSPRFGPAMTYDLERRRVVMFGGWNGSSLGDTWEWDESGWRLVATSVSPSARYGASLSYDRARQRIVLFGGSADGGITGLDDTWEWDGINWLSHSPPQRPPGRWFGACDYDPVRRQVVLFAGSTFNSGSTTLSDTWQWNGTTWSLLPLALAPSSRGAARMVRDPASARMLLFGGSPNGLTTLSDTWALNNLVSADDTLVSTSTSVVSAFGGITTLMVTPKDVDGHSLGAGIAAALSTTAGTLLGSITDNADGTYTQTLQATPTAAGAVVSATVNGVAITDTASVTFIAIDPAQSTITVSPDTTFLGGHATVTVTPKDDQGAPVGAGKTIVLQTTLGALVGSITDNADGTYTQRIDATALGTASITATADGLPLTPSASLTVLDSSLGRVIGLRTDQTALPYDTIQQAVNRAEQDQLARILVNPGTYEEVVTVKGMHDLAFEGLSASGLVTVRGFRISQSRDLSFAYFDIDASSNARHGIELLGGHHRNERVTVRDCLVHATTDNFDGIRIGRDNCDIDLRDLRVEANAGDGLSLADGPCEAIVTDVTILTSGRNGIRSTDAATVRLERCRIEDSGARLDDRQGYAIFRQRRHDGGNPAAITLVGNTFAGNRGRVVAGKSDANIGNYDQVLDPTDSQPGY